MQADDPIMYDLFKVYEFHIVRTNQANALCAVIEAYEASKAERRIKPEDDSFGGLFDINIPEDSLTKKQAVILSRMINSPKKKLSTEAIMSILWPTGDYPERLINCIRKNMYDIRKFLKTIDQPYTIKTVYSWGYILVHKNSLE